jgi:hypothetical protein
MRALIRNPGETVTEKDGIAGIDWNTGAPLTNPSWAGGPYSLVQDYIAPIDGEVEFEIQERGAGVEHANDPAPETVTIDGKEYTKDELLAILNQTA